MYLSTYKVIFEHDKTIKYFYIFLNRSLYLRSIIYTKAFNLASDLERTLVQFPHK